MRLPFPISSVSTCGMIFLASRQVLIFFSSPCSVIAKKSSSTPPFPRLSKIKPFSELSKGKTASASSSLLGRTICLPQSSNSASRSSVVLYLIVITGFLKQSVSATYNTLSPFSAPKGFKFKIGTW